MFLYKGDSNILDKFTLSYFSNLMSDFYAIQYISTENTSEYAAELTLNHFLTVSVACVCVVRYGVL